MSVEGSDP